MRKHRKKKLDDRIIDFICYGSMILLCISIIVPFLQIITISLSPSEVVHGYGLKLFPTQVTLEGYRKVLQNSMLWSGYKNTIGITFIGTIFCIACTTLGAYPLSKKDLPYRTFIIAFFVFTMYFGGGLIPSYLVNTKLGFLNNRLVFIIPAAVNTYYMIIMRNFFAGIPSSLEESARIDGASNYRVLWSIILPLSKPIVATLALWYGVNFWNQWFQSMLYIEDAHKHTLNYALRLILFAGTEQEEVTETVMVASESLKMASLLVATIPIMCVYPFIQKYFTKGVMVGSLKG